MRGDDTIKVLTPPPPKKKTLPHFELCLFAFRDMVYYYVGQSCMSHESMIMSQQEQQKTYCIWRTRILYSIIKIVHLRVVFSPHSSV